MCDLWSMSPYSSEDHWSGRMRNPASVAICTICASCSFRSASYVRNWRINYIDFWFLLFFFLAKALYYNSPNVTNKCHQLSGALYGSLCLRKRQRYACLHHPAQTTWRVWENANILAGVYNLSYFQILPNFVNNCFHQRGNFSVMPMFYYLN